MPKSVAKLALTTGVMVLTTLISAPVSAQTNGNPVLSPAQPQTSQAVKPTNEGAIIRSVKVVPDAAPPAEWRAPTAEERAIALRSDPLVKAAFFERIFEHDPRDSASGLILSGALREMGRNAEAADIAHRILVLDPKNYEALLAAARAHIGNNDAFQAIEPLRQAQIMNPKDWQPVSLMAVALDQVHRYDEAQATFTKALTLSPGNPVILTNLAMTLVVQGRFAEAEPLLRIAVRQQGATAQTRQNLALVLGLQNHLQEAEYWLRIDLPPEIADRNLAWLKQQALSLTSAPGSTVSHDWNSVKKGG